MGRRKKTFGANYCHTQVLMMAMKKAETTHPIYFAAAITHMHAHTLIHQAPKCL